MKIKKLLSVLLACMLFRSLLPSASAIDCAVYAACAAPAQVSATPAENAGPRSFMTATQDAAAEDGAAFHPYVFTVDEDASVSASVRMQPALMQLSAPETRSYESRNLHKYNPPENNTLLDTTVTVTVTNDPVFYGEDAQIVATICADGPETNVTFRIDSVDYDTVSITNRIAVFNLQSPELGQHEVEVVYNTLGREYQSSSNSTTFRVVDAGSGTEADPYRIGNKAMLHRFRDIVNGGSGAAPKPDAWAVMTADVDLENTPWTPIARYSGCFDGAGHVISGLNVSAESRAGLFDEINNGTVQRLGVRGSVTASDTNGSDVYAGGIAAYLMNDATTISECWFSGTVRAASNETVSVCAGGIAGVGCDGPTVRDCWTDGAVHAETGSQTSGGSAYAGGVVGSTDGNASNCYHYGGNVTAAAYSDIPDTPGGDAAGIANGNPPTQCYYLNGTAPDEGLTAAQFNQTDSFFEIDNTDKNWNFTGIWHMDEEAGRPMLREAASVDLEVEDSNAFGEPLQINATVSSPYATGNLNLIVVGIQSNETYSLELANGYASQNITPLFSGTYYITASYDGDQRFLPCMARRLFTVEGQREWSDLQSAVSEGGTVNLTLDVTYMDQALGRIEVPENKSVTLDLQGHTIDRNLTAPAENGGVFYVSPNSNLTILDSVGGGVIAGGNTADYGGAVYVDNGASLTVTNVTFSDNTAGNAGGAIYAASGADLAVADCVFTNNAAGNYSAIHLPATNTAVSRSTFINNTAADFGVIGSAWDSHADANVTGCVFLGNPGNNVIDFADSDRVNTDGNWFGNTADDYMTTPLSANTSTWYYVNLTCTIDETTGQYAFGAALWSYNSSANNVTRVAPSDYRLPEIALDGFASGTNLTGACDLGLRPAGYGSVVFQPDSANYTVGFTAHDCADVSLQRSFNRTIKVNLPEGQDLYFDHEALKTERITALENGEAIPSAVLAGKTLSIDVGNETYTFTLSDNGDFLLDLNDTTPGTHDVCFTVPGFAPLETTIDVAKLPTPIDVFVGDSFFVGAAIPITVRVAENATGNITIHVAGSVYTDEIKDGAADFSLTGLAAGTYTVNASYEGDDNYLPINATPASFHVEVIEYTITWKNDDGSVIDTTTAEYGVVPTHADATKAATAEYTYTFAGWTPAVEAVTGNATYTANFTATKKSYTITWKNDDGSVIDTTTVEYGVVPTHADATKAATAEYTYTFAGWTPAVEAVTGNASYTATFTATAKPGPAPEYDDWTPPRERRFHEVDPSKGGSLEKFERSRNYTAGIFIDANPAAWYFENVAAAYEYGLMEGMGDGTFGVGADLKFSEALALVCRLHNIYYGGSGRFDQTKDRNWYTVYEDYAVRYGVITKDQYNLTAPVTRAQFAEIISAALPDAALKPINNVTKLPDMVDDDPRLPAILRLYNAGILTGMDAEGTFRPDAPIPRTQIAAIATRVVDPALRKVFILS